jgi:cysteine desulfurase
VQQIYLDYNATTPVAPSVVEAMQTFLTGHYGNPSSSHAMGRAAAEAIEDARSKLSVFLGCDRDEVIFTSGGTESNNFAIKGIMLKGVQIGNAYAARPPHLVISAIEHPAVSQPAKFLERMGCEVTTVDCDRDGVVCPNDVEAAIQPNTRLVSIMHANNEIGTIQPIRRIAEVCHREGVLIHTDASQSAGKISTTVDELGVDLLTIAGHKFYGPKGVGALFIREGLELEPHLHGAGHEQGLRAGTENTAYIVGMAQAANLVGKSLDDSYEKMSELRDLLQERLVASVPGLHVNGGLAERLPNTLSVSFPRVAGHELLARVPEICCSTSSACHSDGVSGSATLAAMGASPERMAGKVRLSVGWHTSTEEVERSAEVLIGAWESMAG